MHANGEGMPQDDEAAFIWYRLAAEQGHPLAQFHLGWMHANGVGVPQSDEEALKWYCMSAEQGHIHAQFLLGTLYAETNHAPLRDDIQAYAWASLAVFNGDRDAGELRDMLAKRMSPVQLIDAKELVRKKMVRVLRAR
ncbi:MAG: sel1 repeat family protein [Magnetococcales bacterium]|nr:sel1 repeat family protein [Magnetococcales bacterium]